MARRKVAKPNNADVSVNAGGGKSFTVDLGTLYPKQREFFESTTLYTAYGGARGGGKSHAIRVTAVSGALKYPGIRILIVRKSYPELQQNHIEPLLKMVPQQLASYNGTVHCMYFVNGSTIKFGYLSGLESEQTYQGQEYDWIFLDEATQFSERQFRILGGCLRGVNAFPKRFYLTCNPGGIGHAWVKRLFIDKKYKTDSPNPEENENPKDYKFIFATVEDNIAFKKADPVGYQNYLKMLSQLPENIRNAHRYGDWNALSGAFFPEFSEKRHVIRSIDIPRSWNKYRALDYGLDMLACYWIAVDEYGRSYVYRELCMPNLTASDAALKILEYTPPFENIITTFVPPDMWNRQKDTGKTIAEVFLEHGLGITRADNNLFQGGMMIKEFLKDMPDGKPALVILDNCKQLIEHISIIQADEKDPNKYAKEPHEITHTVDAIRYYCISRTLPTEVPEEPEYYDEDDYEEDYESYMTGGEVTSSYLEF